MNKQRAQRFLDRMAMLEEQGHDGEGWGPSVARLEAGQSAFAGLVTTGPWVGHDALVHICVDAPWWWDYLLGNAQRRELVLAPIQARSFEVDFWGGVASGEALGPGDDYVPFWPEANDDGLAELVAYLEPMKVQWYAPVEAGRACMRPWR